MDDARFADPSTPATRIVVTGGPGAGKTAILELARRHLCRHVEVLPESASIVFGGGFPRRNDEHARRCAQRAIYRVQSELESLMTVEGSAQHPKPVLALCDRGTLDTLAYWPGTFRSFFEDLGTTMEAELARYAAVLHLRVPEDATEYRQTMMRKETHAEARAIDTALLEVWATHPQRIVIDGATDFMVKARRALEAIERLLPDHRCPNANHAERQEDEVAPTTYRP